jgi:tRNA pseudouridine13 synthase
MLQQNYSKAIDLLLTGRRMIHGIDLVEANDVEPFRRIWKETNGNAVATAKALPSGSHSVPRERAVIKGLVRYGTDQPLLAFRCLPRNERLFFINAVRLLIILHHNTKMHVRKVTFSHYTDLSLELLKYQSYVWNMMTTERMQLYGNQVVVGDIVLIDNKPIHVTESDLSDESKKEVYHMSNVVLPMPGYDTIYPDNQIGTLYKEFLEKENVVFDKNATHDEAKARGSYRKVIAHVDQFTYERLPTESSSVDVQLKFNLPKGSYATMLLRELFLKTVARDDPEIYHTNSDPDEEGAP